MFEGREMMHDKIRQKFLDRLGRCWQWPTKIFRSDGRIWARYGVNLERCLKDVK
jgi:hypothetical protein